MRLLLVFGLCLGGAGSAWADLISKLQETSPTPTTYVFNVDQTAFGVSSPGIFPGVTGMASGPLFFVPSEGCAAADFSGFVAGDIAIIDRGGCAFNIKANLAQAAGAPGFIIADNIAEAINNHTFGFFPPVPGIPGVFVTMATGAQLEAAAAGSASVVLSVTDTPEASTGFSTAFGLFIVAGYVCRRRSAA